MNSGLSRGMYGIALACASILLAQPVSIYAQDQNDLNTSAWQIRKVDAAVIRLDGQLDETIWQELSAVDAMQVVEPDTLQSSRYETLTRLFYTDRGLYLGITAEQPPESLIPRLSSRDADINRDGITVYLDTSGESLYGY